MTLLTLLVLISLFIFTIGVCIGSFLNVVICRAFSNESIVWPGSKCPSCQTPLKWYHNIPIFSYLFLKGKCAFCKETISFQYPIVELITGILFVSVFWKFDSNIINAIFIAVFTSLFVVIAATDIKERVIFDFHTYILIGVGLIYNFFNIGHLYLGDKVLTLGTFSIGINNSFIASILGIVLGVIVMEALARLGYLFAATRAFGEGDSYIAAGLGAIFGWKYLILVLIYSFIIQIVLTIPVFIKKLFMKKDFLTLSTFLVFVLLLIIIKWFNYSEYSGSLIVFGILTLLLFSVGFYFCKRILSGIKDKENLTYLPFGPALVISGFILFFTM